MGFSSTYSSGLAAGADEAGQPAPAAFKPHTTSAWAIFLAVLLALLVLARPARSQAPPRSWAGPPTAHGTSPVKAIAAGTACAVGLLAESMQFDAVVLSRQGRSRLAVVRPR